MSLAERNYPPSAPTKSREPYTICQILLALNVLVFFADRFFLNMRLEDWGAYSTPEFFQQHQWWRLFSFQFLHSNVGHILANMMGLYFFGPWLEQWWGRNKFLAFYLLCGASGALLFSLLSQFPAFQDGESARLVGASAGLYGILIGAAIVAPHLRVQLLIPPVELSIRTLALGVLGFALVTILFRWGSNVGGEIGHLGGAIFGFVLLRFPYLLGKKASATPYRQTTVSHEQEIDRILAKISQRGINSLSAQEREFLQKQKD